MWVSFASARGGTHLPAQLDAAAPSAPARDTSPAVEIQYSSIAATRRATLLLPDPAGPSMAIVRFGIFVAQPILAA